MQTFVQKHKNLWLRLTQWALYAALFTPLVVMPDTLIFPFVTPKGWFFQSVVVIAAAFYLLLISVEPSYRPRKNALTVAVVAFIAIMAISTFTGVDVKRSLFANHERMLGLVTLIHFVAFYLMAVSVFRTREAWRRFWCIFLGVAALVLLSAAVQHWRPDFLYGGDRAASTLGNPIYLALFAVYAGFITCLVWFDEVRTSTVWWKKWQTWVLAALLALSFFGFILAETRGVFVGVGAAVVWMLAWIASAGATRPVRWSALALLAIFAIGLIGFGATNDHTAFNNIPGLRRFADLSLSNGTNANRIFAWNVALDAWKEKPLFGWGPFNYVYAFNERYQGTQMRHNAFGETWFDNAHNFFLDTLVTQGILGFLAYVALFVVALWLLIRGWWRGQVPLATLVLLSGLLVMHAVQNLFAFEQITSYVTFFAVLAYVSYVAMPSVVTSVNNNSASLRSPSTVFVGAVMVGAVSLLYYTNYLPFRANTLMFEALRALDTQQDATTWFTLQKKASEIRSPYVDHIREEMGRVLLRVKIKQGDRSQELQNIFRITIAEVEKAVERHPRDPIYQMVLAEVWYASEELMPNDFSQGATFGDQAFQQAILASPERQQLYLLWADHKLRVGKVAEGLELMRKARSFSPSSAFMLRLYGEYLDSARINKIESANSKDLSFRLSPELYGIHEAEQIALDMAKYGNGPRSIDMMRALLACKGHDTGMACPAPFVGVSYNPSRDVFLVLVRFYRGTGDREAAEKYETFAKMYFNDFTVEEPKKK